MIGCGASAKEKQNFLDTDTDKILFTKILLQ